MASLTGLEVSYAILLTLIAILSIRWAYRTIHGTPVTFVSLVVMSFVYVLIFTYAALNSVQTLDNVFLLLFVTIAVIAAVIAARYVERLVRFDVRPDGGWYFRLGLFLPVLYISILLIRLVENLYLLHLDPFLVQLPPGPPVFSPVGRILLTSNALFAAGTGFLVGRNIGVRRAYLRERARSARGPPEASTA